MEKVVGHVSMETANTVLEVAELAWAALECRHSHSHHDTEPPSGFVEEDVESLRSENHRLRLLLEKNLTLMQEMSASPGLQQNCPPDLHEKILSGVSDGIFLNKLESLSENFDGGTCKFPFDDPSGLLPEGFWSLLKSFLLFCCLISITNANLGDNTLEREYLYSVRVLVEAGATRELPLPANLSLSREPRKKHPSPYVAPAQSPGYGHYVISAPHSSPLLSKPSMEKSGKVPASTRLPAPHLSEIAPTQAEPNTIPTGLSQPPLSPGIAIVAPPKIPSAPAAVNKNREKPPSLVLAIGFGALILIIAVISMVIVCLCVSQKEKNVEPSKETCL